MPLVSIDHRSGIGIRDIDPSPKSPEGWASVALSGEREKALAGEPPVAPARNSVDICEDRHFGASAGDGKWVGQNRPSGHFFCVMMAIVKVRETGLTESQITPSDIGGGVPGHPMTDGALVQRVLGGERSAFAELYDRRAGLVRAMCFDNTRDQTVAADLTQEVFLRAFRGLGSLSDQERFAAWLMGIARQVCREWVRRRQSERKFKLRYVRPESAEPEDASGDSLDRLRNSIAELPEGERLALHAFYLQGMDVEEARGVLGLSRSGLYRVLSCARRRLARKLSREEMI